MTEIVLVLKKAIFDVGIDVLMIVCCCAAVVESGFHSFPSVVMYCMSVHLLAHLSVYVAARLFINYMSASLSGHS